jgi:hypothetical protein
MSIWSLFPQVTEVKREDYNSLPPRAQVKNEWSHTSILPYILGAQRGKLIHLLTLQRLLSHLSGIAVLE